MRTVDEPCPRGPSPGPVRHSLPALVLLVLIGIRPATAVEVTSLKITSDPADFVAAGLDYYYTAQSGTFAARRNPWNGVSVTFWAPDILEFWSLDFTAPYDALLAPGMYEGATDYPNQAQSEPGLGIHGIGRACGSSTGRFEVIEIVYGQDHEIVSFRARFEQHCGLSLSALRGEIRVGANMFVEVTAPERLAVLAGGPLEIEVSAVSLDGTGISLAAAGLPDGAVFEDHGTGIGRLIWTPSLNQVGTHTVAFMAQNPLGEGEGVETEISVGRTIRVPDETATIQGAIQVANSGSRIEVAPGTYRENIDFLGKALVVESQDGPDVTIIDGGAIDAVVTFARVERRGSVLSGFTIRNGRTEDRPPYFRHGGGISIYGSSPTVRDNVITGNYACWGGGLHVDFGSPLIVGNSIAGNRAGCGAGGGGISIGGAAKAEVINNLIEENSAVDHGGGMLLWAAGTPRIEGNVIRGNAAQEGGGIWMVNYSDAEIVGNLIYRNSAGRGGGVYWLVRQGFRGPLLVSNTIAENDAVEGSAVAADGFDAAAELVGNLLIAKSGQPALWCGEFYDPGPPALRHNDVYSSSAAPYGAFCGADLTGIDGNISVDPAFSCPELEDFRPVAGSPVIDAGDNAIPLLPDEDFAGRPRVLDGDGNGTPTIDLGAYEFDPSAPPSGPCVYAFCPADIQVDAPRGEISAVVEYPPPIAPAAATVSCAPISGSEFPESTTQVTCVAALTSGHSATCSFAVTVTVRPLNDRIADATVITALPFTDRMDTRNATADLSEPYCTGQAPAVWYSYTPPEDLILTLDTAGSSYDVQLSSYIYFGDHFFWGSICGPGPFTFLARAGTTHWFAARPTGPSGDLVFALRARVPLTLQLGIDERVSIDRRTGDATVTGTATCSRRANLVLTGDLQLGRPEGSIIRPIRLEIPCDGATAWGVSLPGSGGRAGGSRAMVRVTGHAEDPPTGDTADGEATSTVLVRPLRTVRRGGTAGANTPHR